MTTMALSSALNSSLSVCVPKYRLQRASPALRTALRVRAAPKEVVASAELSFEPFEEVKGELVGVSEAPVNQSYARLDYHPECEAAVNEQINIEYTISYVYHSLYAFFDRDNVGLPGFAKYFKDASEEERGHAELLMAFQNKRGGRVQLHSLTAPQIEYDHEQKGEALYAMELVLSLERLNFQKLRALHDVSAKHGDAEMCDFIEGQLLSEQAAAVKGAAENVAQLRRVGKGLGVYQFDKQLA